MDPEEAGNDPKSLMNTVVGDVNDDENSVPPKAASNAQAGPELHTKNGPDAFDGIEGQIALDSFLSGRSERPLMELLARMEGLNVDDCVLRLRPWEPSAEGDGAQLEFLGAVDQLVDPNDHYGSLSYNIKPHLEPGAAQVHNRETSNRDQQLVAASPTATNVPTPEPTTLQHASIGYIEPDEIFEYDDLPTNGQHFRLLGLGPPDEHGNISSLTLHTVDINNAPPFYAISYVWYNPQLEVPMTCNHKKLMITNSLGSALEKLVPWSRGTYLWADGICINQGNIAERNHQVTLMGNIYGRASKVLAHLADSRPNEDDSRDWSAVSLMTLLNRIWLNEPNPSPRSESEWMKVLAINHDNAAMWESLVLFWMNPWFTRCWIMQEAVLADNVVLFYGKAICSLNAVTTFWDLTQRHELPGILRYSSLADTYMACRNMSLVGSFKRLRELHQKPSVTGATPESLHHLEDDVGEQKVTLRKDHRSTSDSLCNLLAMSRCKNATDERDKVYALLALAQDSLAKTVQPDYSAENTTSQVYCDVAEECVRQGYGVELLHYSGKDHVTQGLPSWVPDWSRQTRSTFHSTEYCFATFSKPKITLSLEPGHLHVRGAIIDSFEYLGFPCRFYSLKPSEDRLYRELMDNNDKLPPVETDMHMRQVIYATSKVMFDQLCSTDNYPEGLNTAMARTLTADCTRTGERSEGDPAYMEGFEAFKRFNEASLQMSVLSKPVEPDSGAASLLDEAWPYECVLQDVHKGRRICVTKGRYMGVTTYDTKKGDLLVMFEGFAMPFVLRPEGDNFVIIGDCYIHGVMDGELVCVPEAKFRLDASQQGVDKNGDDFCVRSLTGGFATFQKFTIV